MQSAREMVDDALLEEEQDGPTPLQHEVAIKRLECVLDRLVKMVQEKLGVVCFSKEQIEQERASGLQRELQSVQDAHLGSLHMTRVRMDILPAVIHSLRTTEQTQAFWRALVREQQQGTEQFHFSLTNFAFGHTPFDSWLQICSQRIVRETVARIHTDCTDSCKDQAAAAFTPAASTAGEDAVCVHAPCVVFGSSSGSLVFFSALLLGIDCVGVEILACLHHHAEQFREQFAIPHCSFLLHNMLDVTLCDTRVLVLTSQCWDDELYARVLARVALQLPLHALVIDYRCGLDPSPSFSCVVRMRHVAVSWLPQGQTIAIYRKETPQTATATSAVPSPKEY